MQGRRVYSFPPSQEFSVRPQFREVLKGIELIFDEEGPTGYEERALMFQGVLRYRCTRLVATSPWMTGAYDVLVDLEDSPWLNELRKNYHGHDQFDYRHYAVFFDDHGFYEVIARSFKSSKE